MSIAVVGQIAGLIAFIVGLFLLVGLAWSLIAGGAVVVIFCAVMEAQQTPINRKAG